MGMQTNGIEETSFAPAGCRSGNLRKSGTENLYDATEFYEHRRGLQPMSDLEKLERLQEIAALNAIHGEKLSRSCVNLFMEIKSCRDTFFSLTMEYYEKRRLKERILNIRKQKTRNRCLNAGTFAVIISAFCMLAYSGLLLAENKGIRKNVVQGPQVLASSSAEFAQIVESGSGELNKIMENGKANWHRSVTDAGIKDFFASLAAMSEISVSGADTVFRYPCGSKYEISFRNRDGGKIIMMLVKEAQGTSLLSVKGIKAYKAPEPSELPLQVCEF